MAQVRLAASTVPGARTGVVVTTPTPTGTVVATYPGVLWTPAEIARAGGAAALDPREPNDYFYWRLDGCLLDPTFGARYDAVPESRSEVQERLVRARAGCSSPNALGEMVNHPSRGIKPNVVTWNVELSHEHVEQFGPLLPNTMAHQKNPFRPYRYGKP